MSAPVSTNKPLLELASLEVIRQYEKKTGEPITGLYFNKLMSLVYAELRNRYNINIELPHCWYRYGDEVVRYLMPNAIRWNHETPQYTTVTWVGQEPLTQREEREIIKRVVKETIKKYEHKSKEELVDDVYSSAPFTFQRNFRQLRLNIEGMAVASVGISNFKEVLRSSLEQTIESFPKKEFPNEVYERITNYYMLMKKLLELPEFNVEIAKELTEDIWFYFSYYLRIHKKCYENIPRNVIEYWKSQLEFQKNKFDRFFAEILLTLNSKNILFEGELQEILEKRKQEKKEELQFIENF